MDKTVEGTWKIVSFWECQQCFGLLPVGAGEIRCDSCHPLESITVSSEDFSKDVAKYTELARERTVRVVSGELGKECYMTMGPLFRMR